MAISLGDLIFEIGLEDGAFQQGLKAANTKMETFAKSAKATGGKLTAGLTVPIAGLGVASLKLAADFEVSSKKFAKAFEGAGDEAAESVRKLNEEYGIATSQGTELLAFTGDLLKGFGATSDEALKMAESTNILAASLGAYNGVPVAQASAAITSALTGERDALKGLGIVISEEAVKQQLAIDGTSELTGQELLLAKGKATLTLAYKQSSDAVASFSENTGTASFQTAALLADAKDLGVEFGTLLLPVLKDGIAIVKDLLGNFSDLSTEQKETILKTAALVASLGPAILVVGNVTTAVKGLSAAFSLLVANPAILGVAVAIGSIAAGIAIVNKHLQESSKLAEVTQRLADGTASYADKLSIVNAELEKESAKSLEQRNIYNNTRGQVADNARAKLLEIEAGISGIRRTITAIEDERDAELGAIEDALKAEQEAQAKVAKLAAIEAEAEAKKKLAKEAIIAKYVEQNEKVQDILDSNKSEIELIDEEIDSISELAEVEGDFNDDRLEALDILEERKIEIQEAIEEADEAAQEAIEEAEQAKLDTKIDFENQWKEKVIAAKASRTEALALEYAEALAHAEAIGADTLEIDKYYALAKVDLEAVLALEKEEIDKAAKDKSDADRADELAKQEEYYKQIIAFAASTVGSIGTIFSGLTDIKINLLETETQALIDGLDQSTLTEEEYAEKVLEIKNAQALEEYEIKLEAFKAQRAIDTTDTIIQTATNAVAAFGALAGIPVVGPGLGIIAAAAATAAGLVQVGIIQSQPAPVRPQLALGGIVNPTATGTDVTIGEAGSSEAVIPLNDRFFNKLANAATGSTLGNTGAGKGNNNGLTTINLVLDGNIVAKSTVDIINNKIYTIDSRSIR